MAPIVITYSSLGKYQACKRLWYWSEYLRLRKKIEPQTGPLPFGRRVHFALELWGKGKIDAPVDIWNHLMEQEISYAESHGWPTGDLDKESKTGHAMLSNFPEWLDSKGFWDRFETVAVEEVMGDELPVSTPWGAVTVRLQGKLDQLIRRKLDGMYFDLDWKTTQAVAPSVLTVMEKSPQFRIYAKLTKMRNPKLRMGGAVLLLLRKVQQTKVTEVPFYAELEIPMSKYDMDEYMARLEGSIIDLLTTVDRLEGKEDWRKVVPFSPSRVNCPSCPFRAPCDMMRSFPAGAQDLLATEYVEHNPLARYEETDEIDNLLA